MRISISLECQKDGSIIEKITKDDNVSYLVKGEDNLEFPYLSVVESYGYSVFDGTDMEVIVQELLLVRQELVDDQDKKHIDDIVRLANQCKKTPGTILVFAG